MSGLGIVKTNQIFFVLRTLGDDSVGLRNNAILDLQPLFGKAVGLCLVKPTDVSQRVEVTTKGMSACLRLLRTTSPDIKKLAWMRS